MSLFEKAASPAKDEEIDVADGGNEIRPRCWVSIYLPWCSRQQEADKKARRCQKIQVEGGESELHRNGNAGSAVLAEPSPGGGDTR